MHQPVEWQEWGEDAFARAAAEDKPILLDIGAVWVSLVSCDGPRGRENAETAKVINERFAIAVKVDRMSDRMWITRYQAAVSAISEAGRMAADSISDSEGKPYFGGFIFRRRTSMGARGFSGCCWR